MKITIQDGQEYITGWQDKLIRLYTLDDGSKITINMLVSKVANCTKTCARARLNKHTDPKILFRPIREQVLSLKKSRYKPNSDMIDPQTWYKDPLVKLMLK